MAYNFYECCSKGSLEATPFALFGFETTPKVTRASVDSVSLNEARIKVINLYRAWYREVRQT